MTVGVGAKVGGTRGRRLEPAEDQLPILEEEEQEAEEAAPGQRAPGDHLEDEAAACAANSKQVAFAVLPDKYQPLGTDGEARKSAKSRKKKLKKYGKNVGKVLLKGCRYVVLGLQGLANAYSSPFGAAASVVTLFR